MNGDRARTLTEAALGGLPIVALGCGPGGYAAALGGAGHVVVGVDAASAMVALARKGELCVQADLEALPFGFQSLGGAWSRNAYLHVPPAKLPLALAHLHHGMAVGAPMAISLLAGRDFTSEGDLPGRASFGWKAERLAEVVMGAGFVNVAVEKVGAGLWVTARRCRTLPDFVGPGMRLLVCGLNPSLVAADAGYGFSGASNRFWKAAVAAGLVSQGRDPWRALAVDQVGMTDLVKRATNRAAQLTADEYRAGADRVARLVEWLRPLAVCFVGLEGWRVAVDRQATSGWQPGNLGGTPAYVMPSSSGLNARTTLAELTDHLRSALDPRQAMNRG